MTSTAKIELREASLIFRTYGALPSLKHKIVDTIYRRRQMRCDKYLPLFENFNLKINSGERVGIIGVNGSGKSSLLRLIANIYKPHSGVVDVQGQLTALFGLGLGVHPELSGYENIIASGLYYGNTSFKMRQLTDDILEFAGLVKFGDMPFKNYSNGMRTRLLFSIAVHINPQMLALDEVFAGGDIEFQQKAQKKLLEMIDGCEIFLFVSHSIELVKKLCNRVVWLQHGKILKDGNSQKVCDAYIDAQLNRCNI